jgi:hypothetical protein
MTDQDPHRYDDIINLPHPTSLQHPRMDAGNRAAQFAPFAALTGYEDAIQETGRLTEGRVLLDESEREELDRKLQFLWTAPEQSRQAAITYFVPDGRKAGGAYVTAAGQVEKLETAENRLLLSGVGWIDLADIIKIEL